MSESYEGLDAAGETGTKCLRALLDIVAAGVRGGDEPDPRLVEALDESRVPGGTDRRGCRAELCGAACDAVIRREHGRIWLAVSKPTDFDSCREE